MAQIDDSARATELTSANPFVPTGVLMMERDTGKTKLGPGFWNDLQYWQTRPAPVLDVALLVGSSTLTNQAAAEALVNADGRNTIKVDLTGYTEVRLVTSVLTQSAVVGSKVNLQYHTAFSTTAADHSPIGTSAVEASLETLGSIVTAWVPLAAAAKADVYVALISVGGDGAADPIIGAVHAQFR